MSRDETRFETALALIENVHILDDMNEALSGLCKLYQVANLGYHARHIDGIGSSELPVFATWDPAWGKSYDDRELGEIDPFAKAGKHTDLPIDWADVDRASTDTKRFFSELSSYEVGGNGMSIPIHSPHGTAIFTFTSYITDDAEWRSFRRERKPELSLLARYLHERIITAITSRRKPISLSRQEQACLQLYAKGHNAPVIAEALGLSVHTVRMHLGRAQKRLQAHSRAEAVAKAISGGLIRLRPTAMILATVSTCDLMFVGVPVLNL